MSPTRIGLPLDAHDGFERLDQASLVARRPPPPAPRTAAHSPEPAVELPDLAVEAFELARQLRAAARGADLGPAVVQDPFELCDVEVQPEFGRAMFVPR